VNKISTILIEFVKNFINRKPVFILIFRTINLDKIFKYS